MLRQVGIPDARRHLKSYPHQLSGGMCQRILIAMMVACEPKLLIADEPTTGLDVTVQAQIFDLIKQVQGIHHMAMLLITHDLGIIAENAETVAIMYAGRIVEQAPVAALFEGPRHPYTVGLLGSVPESRGTPLTPIRGMVPKPGELPEGCAFSDRCDHAVDACHLAEPALEEVAPGHLSRCIRRQEAPWSR